MHGTGCTFCFDGITQTRTITQIGIFSTSVIFICPTLMGRFVSRTWNIFPKEWDDLEKRNTQIWTPSIGPDGLLQSVIHSDVTFLAYNSQSDNSFFLIVIFPRVILFISQSWLSFVLKLIFTVQTKSWHSHIIVKVNGVLGKLMNLLQLTSKYIKFVDFKHNKKQIVLPGDACIFTNTIFLE